MSSPRILIYLLRRDLRLHDNPIFHEISSLNKQSQKPFTHLLPLYIFPAQQVEVSGFLSSKDDKSPYPEARSEVGGFWRCGRRRSKFLAESVWDLKNSLEKAGSGLVVRVGMVGKVVQDIIDAVKKNGNGEVIGVWMTAEDGVEEKREERDVRNLASNEGVQFKLWADEKYLIDDRDLPFKDAKDLPDVFTTFRKQVEPLRDSPRDVLPIPDGLPALPETIPPQSSPFKIPDSLDGIIEALHAPVPEFLEISDPPKWPSGTKSAHPFIGGTKTGQERIDHLISSSAMSTYKDTRNGLLGEDFSTKLSAWLALGCITAREVHARTRVFEDGTNEATQFKGAQGFGKGENKGTSAVRFELLWRDYMRLCTRKFGPRLFRISGFRNDDSYPWKSPSKNDTATQEKLARFLNGTTGASLIDASQRELLLTGYTSNRARQNVASFLAKHLGIDWRIGAEWYEATLVDYDVSSNWGNWQYVAGVGNDPRGSARVFNPVKQSFDYDKEGAYAKAWVEEVRGVQDLMGVFQPWTVSEGQRKEVGLEGYIGAEEPLKRIDFRPHGGGGGRGGGNDRGRGRGRGGGGNGGYRGRGRGGGGRGRNDRVRGGTGQGRMGPNDKAQRFSDQDGAVA